MGPGGTGLGKTGAGGTRPAGRQPFKPATGPAGGAARGMTGSSAAGNTQRVVRKKPQPRNDYSMAYTAAAAVVLLVIAFFAGWAYLKPQQDRIVTDVAFGKAGPFHIETDGYTYNATLAIQTKADNGRWLKRNQEALNDLLYRTLVSTNPKIMSTPAGLAAVQETLTRTINQSLDQPRVEHVLFTDFVLQAD